MSGGQIDLSKIRKGWYAHVIYTSEGEEETVTGRITRQDSIHIVIRVQEERALKFSKTLAYRDINTLVISQHAQSIEARQLLHEGNAKVRARVPSIQKEWMVGKVVKMTQDTLVIRGDIDAHRYYQVPHSSISNFEVNVGQHRNTGKGMAIGFGIGVGILALSSRGIYNADDTRESREWAKFSFFLFAVPAVVLTTLTGTIIGYQIKSDKWVEVSPQGLNLSVAPTSTKGLRAALTFNF